MTDQSADLVVHGIDCRSLQMFEMGVKKEDLPYFGFVYVGDTRIGFDNKDGLWSALHWPEATLAQAQEAYNAIQYEPWGSHIPAKFYSESLERWDELRGA